MTPASLFRFLGTWLVAATATLSMHSISATAQTAFPLHTSGRYIVDRNGARVHLYGVNWYGAESSDYVVAGLQAASLASIVEQTKSMGFNVVRLPWSNQLYESNPVVGNYALTRNPSLQGENALTILDQVIAALTNAGIMVILDNHNSNAEWCCSTTDQNSLWYNSQYSETNWIADWQAMAQRYQNNPLVIGVDLRNEPRSPATWGGSASTDWHAAAQRGGNAVLSVNPNLLIFVEGINYATDLSGVVSLPIQLNVSNQLVYEAHNYGFGYTGLSGYSDYVGRITSKWGYLATGTAPQPLWVGEFGTCNTANTCVNSGSNGDLGFWFNMITAYLSEYGIDWTYWAVNGTESTGSTRTFGAAESYGVLNTTWSSGANAMLSSRLLAIRASAPANISLVSGGSGITLARGTMGNATVTVVPGNGFSGTVNLSCSVSGPSGAVDVPTCSVPATVAVTGNSPATANLSMMTTAPRANNSHPGPHEIFGGFRGPIAACLLLLIGSLAERRRKLLPVLLLAFLPFAGCGGGSATSTNSNPGTTAGSYSVTVTGAATGVSQAMTQISLTIQ